MIESIQKEKKKLSAISDQYSWVVLKYGHKMLIIYLASGRYCMFDTFVWVSFFLNEFFFLLLIFVCFLWISFYEFHHFSNGFFFSSLLFIPVRKHNFDRLTNEWITHNQCSQHHLHKPTNHLVFLISIIKRNEKKKKKMISFSHFIFTIDYSTHIPYETIAGQMMLKTKHIELCIDKIRRKITQQKLYTPKQKKKRRNNQRTPKKKVSVSILYP